MFLKVSVAFITMLQLVKTGDTDAARALYR